MRNLIVLPDEYKDVSIVYPMPTWEVRICNYDSGFCSGHGNCNEAGICVCNAQYYGDICEKFCLGEITTINGKIVCIQDKV